MVQQQHQPLTLDTIDVLNTHLTMSTSTSTSPSPMSIMVKNKSALILIHRQVLGPDYDQGLLQRVSPQRTSFVFDLIVDLGFHLGA